VPVRQVPLQQVAVRQGRALGPEGRPAQVPEDAALSPLSHWFAPWTPSPTCLLLRAGRFYPGIPRGEVRLNHPPGTTRKKRSEVRSQRSVKTEPRLVFSDL